MIPEEIQILIFVGPMLIDGINRCVINSNNTAISLQVDESQADSSNLN